MKKLETHKGSLTEDPAKCDCVLENIRNSHTSASSCTGTPDVMTTAKLERTSILRACACVRVTAIGQTHDGTMAQAFLKKLETHKDFLTHEPGKLDCAFENIRNSHTSTIASTY